VRYKDDGVVTLSDSTDWPVSQPDRRSAP